MAIAAGTKLGRYEIGSKIGAGGMGEVYLAEDTQLHRKVAVKILPAEVASDQDRMRRFVQEAQAAAALNHPNVAHIYEIGEHEGMHFIAMEYVDGLTLRKEIYRERTELRKLLRYLQQVAEGLAKAHAAGVVHRDLKPENVMITADGHAKTQQIKDLIPVAPNDLQRIVRRCLAKDPNKRYQSIKEVANEPTATTGRTAAGIPLI